MQLGIKWPIIASSWYRIPNRRPFSPDFEKPGDFERYIFPDREQTMQEKTQSRSMTGTPRTNITRRIDLTTLRLFIAICEEGNLTRASQREAIAPSAVSKRMHDLEEVLESRCSSGIRTAWR
ncbi:hypothetical protein ABIF63_005567 [Bradyrhizobium japonicum]|uniref:HTH lysR-type domain-containing protein n=1 Tax=Bradyrhizobium japonicum TaxID=375 RepID=A0ABV2RX26_BRAJP